MDVNPLTNDDVADILALLDSGQAEINLLVERRGHMRTVRVTMTASSKEQILLHDKE